ncbi:MAG: penicillin-binding transpeptidase domain-containing protein [Planctomycetota bacterium]
MPLGRHFAWPRFRRDERALPAVVDPRRRMRLCLVGFLVPLLLVFARVVQLEITDGPAFRSEAAKPLVRRQSLPGVRGRILARNGTVLACDKEILALAVHYRWLEEPPNPRWLRWTARSQLSKAERRNPERVAAEEAQVRADRAELASRLARLTGISDDEWRRRARRVQVRVERIAESVNRRHLDEFDRGGGWLGHSAAVPQISTLLGLRFAQPPPTKPSNSPEAEPAGSLFERVSGQVADVLRASMDEPPNRITVAEELEYHVIVEDVPLALVAEVEAHPDRYPCVKIALGSRRAYRAGPLAANVLGHLGPVEPEEVKGGDAEDAYHPEDRTGRAGLELHYEHLLRGRRGVAVELTDRSGRVLSSHRQREPGVGRDLVVTLDPGLQRAAERLLASALERRAIRSAEAEPAGGAILVLDVHTGAVLTAASAPGFDPNLFAGGGGDDLDRLLHDPTHPLFDRTLKMAIPPGSVFKTVSAAALLEAAAVDPNERFFCRGHLDRPDRLRCAIYTRHGIGHNEITLADALAESCNVYFFHHAGQLGPDPWIDWALRFGFGQATGVDLPGEAAGTLPTPATIRDLEGHAWRTADTQMLAIGQGSLQVTPLQVARMMAAVANGGLLVTPHVVSGLGLPELADRQSAARAPEPWDDPIRVPAPRRIPGLDASTLAVIRDGLRRVVSDARGTAHGTVDIESIPIAGKTGTAETGPGRLEHAWFAGYVPADKPKLAFVVVLEHAGDAAEAAGPVANRLVRHMQQLGHLAKRRMLAGKQ